MINIFSYINMKAHISLHGVDPNEYYISVLSTGGVNGVPIFENISNVFSLIFDDVEYDCLKTQYPDGDGLRWARAMTRHQADDLCRFVKQIPTNATINIHCAWGHSRSKAVAAAIENADTTTGNKLVYKLIKERLHK